MRVLLDEDLPHGLRVQIAKHEVQTAVYAGFSGLKNGKLMQSLAAAGFEVFVTADKNLEHQQPLAKMPFGTVVLPSQSLPGLMRCLREIQAAIDGSQPGETVRVKCEGTAG